MGQPIEIYGAAKGDLWGSSGRGGWRSIGRPMEIYGAANGEMEIYGAANGHLWGSQWRSMGQPRGAVGQPMDIVVPSNPTP